MSTTIQVQNDTLEFLKELREQYEVSSYDALLKILIAKAKKPSQSLWGRGGKMKIKEILEGLREKNDRY